MSKEFRPARRERRGVLMSMELVLVLPIIIALFLAIVEFGMLWSANHLVKLASTAGCRVATFPGSNVPAVKRSVELALNKQALVGAYRVLVQGGQHSGDDVAVTVEVPMNAAAPDLLGFFGFSLANRTLVAQTIMRKE